MRIRKNIMKRILFYLFSVICVGGCFRLYAVKQSVNFPYAEAKWETSQHDIKYEPNMENGTASIGIDFDEQLAEKENKLNEIEEEIQLLQMKYYLQELLEVKSNELKDKNPDIVYEKYFQIRQGELARICGIEDMSEYWSTGSINSHFSSPAISIGNNLYIQYINLPGIYEYELPSNLLITGTDVNLGFMGARAGMNFQEIWEKAYEEEIQEGFMYTEDMTVYYIEFTDGYYDYIYYSDYLDGRDTWLIIS